MAAASSPTSREKLTEDYSCGYCLQRLSYMVDPRELPCSHVFCLPCLQADFRKVKVVECNICGQSLDQLTVESLNKVDSNTEAREIFQNSQEILSCDVCEEGKQVAVCYCTDCDKKLCESHLEKHEEFLTCLRVTHSVISIDAYSREQFKHFPEKCADHNETIGQACKECYRIFCLRCPTNASCEAHSSTRHHAVLMLETFAQTLRVEVKESLKLLSDKITEICKHEKAAWRSLDEVEVKVKEMVEEVDRVTEEQVNEIQRISDQLKRDIQDYLQQSVREVEKYTASLTRRREEMQTLWKSSHHLITNSRDSEVVCRQRETVKGLTTAEQAEITPCKPFNGLLVSTGKLRFRSLELRFVNEGCTPPSAIKLSQEKSGQNYYSVCWKSNGDLIVVSNDNLSVYNAKLELLKSVAILGNGTVIEHPNGYIVRSGDSKSKHNTISLYSKDLKFSKEIDTFPAPAHLQFITVNPYTFHIHTFDSENGRLNVSDGEGKRLSEIRIIELARKSLTGIHMLPDESVLLCDFSASCVRKYTINGMNQLSLIWTCNKIRRPYGICSDNKGFIYVAGYQTIYVISGKGELLKELRHPTLDNSQLRDVSVLGDQIAVAVNSTKSLKLFMMFQEES